MKEKSPFAWELAWNQHLAAMWRMLFLRQGGEAEALEALEAALERLRQERPGVAPAELGSAMRQLLAQPASFSRFPDAPPEVRRFLEEGYRLAELATGPDFYLRVAEALGVRAIAAESAASIIGYLSGELEAHGEQELRHRTDQDAVFRAAFDSLAEAWEASGLPWPLPDREAARAFEAWQAAQPPQPRRRPWLPALLLAGFAALAIAAGYAWLRPAPLAVDWQGPGTYALAGGEVRLSENARLRLAGRKDSLEMEVSEGIYFFRLPVPFAVAAADRRFAIRSLGDSSVFRVAYDPSRRFEVLQQQGRAQVSTGNEQFVLRPGDSLAVSLPGGFGYKFPPPPKPF